MSEPEYMTGDELRGRFCAIHQQYWGKDYALPYKAMCKEDKAAWDDLAAVLKVPRPPKPKTLVETWLTWSSEYLRYNEESLESLRVQLNAAREALDKAVT